MSNIAELENRVEQRPHEEQELNSEIAKKWRTGIASRIGPTIIPKNNDFFDPIEKAVQRVTLSRKLSKSDLIPTRFIPRKPSRAKTKNFSDLAHASMDEINRLSQIINDQKLQISQMGKEIKTLRTVTSRQEKAILDLDKEQGEFPHMMKELRADLKTLKCEKQKHASRSSSLEKLSQSQFDQINRLKEKLDRMNQIIKSADNSEKHNLQRQCRQFELERDRETHFAKSLVSKSAKELENAREEISELKNRLKVQFFIQERERQVNSLSIYTSAISEKSGPSRNGRYTASKRFGIQKSSRVAPKLESLSPVPSSYYRIDDEIFSVNSEGHPVNAPIITVKLGEDKRYAESSVSNETTSKSKTTKKKHSKKNTLDSVSFKAQESLKPPKSTYSEDFE